MNAINDLGLVLDIVGALWLGRAIILNPDVRLVDSSGAAFRLNPYTSAALIEQKVDAGAGITLLVFGFIFQFSGASGFDVSFPTALLLGGVFGFGILIFDTCRERLVIAKTLGAIRWTLEGDGPPIENFDILAPKLRRYLRGELSKPLSQPEP